MTKNSVLSGFSPGGVNRASMMSCAFTDSGLLVKAMSWLRTPLSRALDTAPIAAMRTNQTARVRHGWRLLALARDSGLSFIVSYPLSAGGPRSDLRHMLTL